MPASSLILAKRRTFTFIGLKCKTGTEGRQGAVERAGGAQYHGPVSIGTVLERALEILFPVPCLGCGQGRGPLCHGCLAQAPKALPPRCAICWQDWAGGGICHRCQQAPPAFRALRSPFRYEGIVREAIHALKFRGMSSLASSLARPMARLLAAWAPPVEAMVAVPSPWVRERARGYNQAFLLASALAKEVRLPLLRGVLRRRWTPPQVSLPAQRRWQEVAQAVRASRPLPKRRLLLVDDVATTGATLDACARALLAAGAEGVWAITCAREG
jgi:ComF family protein